MRKLKVDGSEGPLTSDVLLALQLRTANDPWFPRLKDFECKGATGVIIPFTPLFLSPNTTRVEITFDKGTPTTVAAPMISGLSTLCPNLERIVLSGLPRASVITDAVSEMLLACNRDTLKALHVDYPLTEEAREVVCKLPRLSHLWVIIQGSGSLPTVALPNLVTIDVEYDHDLNWLQGFRGATLEKLESVGIYS